MSELEKRTTVYFEPDVHEALRLKALDTGRSISELVNEAVVVMLSEDMLNINEHGKELGETDISYESLLEDLKLHGKI